MPAATRGSDSRMPAGAAGGAVLVVQASSDAGEGEIRFNLRARDRAPGVT